MLYVSKGIPRKSGKGKITVAWGGKEFTLEGADARLWQYGCFDSSVASAQSLQTLSGLGLVETAEEDTPLSLYRLLTDCAICPASFRLLRWPMRIFEWRLCRWIKRAGLRLTLAELVYLFEEGIRFVPELLGVDNRQTLVEAIYNTETIADGILESRMEQLVCHAPALFAHTVIQTLGVTAHVVSD